jgi:hypothetical protein
MRIEYQQQKDDVTASSWMMMRKAKITILICLFVVIATAYPNIRTALQQSSSSALVAAVLPLGMCVFVFGFMLWFLPRRAASKVVLRKVVWELSDAGVKVSSDVSEATIKWDAFVKFREGKKVFLIFPQKNFAHFIPKRILSEPEINELRTLLLTHLKKG